MEGRRKRKRKKEEYDEEGGWIDNQFDSRGRDEEG